MANKTSNFPTNQQPNVSREEMGRMTAAFDHLRNLPAIDFKSTDQLRDRIQYYFNWCIDNGVRPGVESMALSIGTSRETLWNWQQSGSERGRIISRAKTLLAALLEQWALTGKVNPTTAIFLQKNHFGYRDEITLEAKRENLLERLPTKEDITKRLASLSDAQATGSIDELIGDVEDV